MKGQRNLVKFSVAREILGSDARLQRYTVGMVYYRQRNGDDSANDSKTTISTMAPTMKKPLARMSPTCHT